MLYVFKDNRNSSSRKETKNRSEASLSCLERTEGSIILILEEILRFLWCSKPDLNWHEVAPARF